MKSLRIATLLVLTVSSALTALAEDPTRIWCIGDSITLGKSVDDNGDGVKDPYPTYRYPLYQKLKAAGWNFDFVGTQTGFCNTTGFTASTSLQTYPDWPDQQHDGWSGYASAQVLYGLYGGFAGIDDVAASMNPDIVLLHIGTNDAYKGYTLADSQFYIPQIIQTIRNVNPNCEFYVAGIIPVAESNQWYDPIKQLSSWIANNIENYSTANSPVHMVDMYTGYDNVNWYVPQNGGNDGVHPEHNGEQFMADKWFEAMHTPEPASMCTLLAGTLVVLRRRRKA